MPSPQIELKCGGRPCPKCQKCSDWYYDRSAKKWNRRDGYTCSHSGGGYGGYGYYNSSGPYPGNNNSYPGYYYNPPSGPSSYPGYPPSGPPSGGNNYYYNPSPPGLYNPPYNGLYNPYNGPYHNGHYPLCDCKR